MGYESRIYIVDKSITHKTREGKTFPPITNNSGKRYAEVIASVDMCKMGDFSDIFKVETDCYIYGNDGNTEIEKDCYGDPLKEAPLPDVIAYLEKYARSREYYRRINPLLSLLKGFNPSDWNALTVLHYGY